MELKQTIESFEFILKYSSPKPDIWELFSESIDFIDKFPHKYDKKIICAFDEFGDIEKFDGDKIVKLVRSKIQMQDNATYIFSGSYASVMETLFMKPDSPFFRFARIINLGCIDRNEFKKYISLILTQNDISVHNKFVDDILRFTKGHPYYTQLVLQQILLNNALEKDQKKISLKKILDELLIIENNYLEKQWEEISRSRELVHILLAIVKYKKSLYSNVDTKKINVSRALKKLTGLGILLKENNRYAFSDPLLELWIKEKVLQN